MRERDFSVQIPQGVEAGGGYVRMKHNTRYTVKMGNHSRRRVDAEVKIDGKFMGLFRLNPGCYVDLDRPSHDKSCFTFFSSSSNEAGDAGVSAVDREARGLVVVTFKPEKDVKGEILERIKSLERTRDVPDSLKDMSKFSPPRHPDMGSTDLYKATLDSDVEKTRFVRGGPGGQSAGGQSAGRQHTNSCRARGGEYESVTTKGIVSPGFTDHCTPPAGVESGITGLTGHSNTDFVSVPELDYDPTLELPITLRLVADKAVRPLTEAPRGNPTPAAVD